MPIPTSTRTTEQRLTALFANAADKVLIESLQTLDAEPGTPDRNRARIWLIDELERRHPRAKKAVEAAFDRAEMAGEDVSYVTVLVEAIVGAR